MDDYREIEFEIPFHIRAPDGFESRNAQFYPRVNGYPVELSFQTNNMSGISVGGTATVRRDRFGNIVRSKVRARFHPQFENLIPDDAPDKGIWPAGKWMGTRNGYYILAAIRAVNTFIEIYREETGSYWMRFLEPGDVGDFAIRDFEDGELEKSQDRTVTLGGTVLGGISPDDFQRIQNRLETGAGTNIYQTLHLDILDRIDLQENSIAIILSDQLFEQWIKNAFVKVAEVSENSDQNPEDLIKKDDGRYISLSNLLSNILEHHTGLDFQNSSIFVDWNEKLRNERNKVVHEDYQPDNKSAKQAHHMSLETIHWFQNQFSNNLKGEPENVEFVETREMKDASKS